MAIVRRRNHHHPVILLGGHIEIVFILAKDHFSVATRPFIPGVILARLMRAATLTCAHPERIIRAAELGG
jgi:hypothetical protein